MFGKILGAVLGGKNWASTVGITGVGAVPAMTQGILDPAQKYGINWNAVLSLGIAYVAGRVTKSANVTGGSVAMTDEAKDRTILQ